MQLKASNSGTYTKHKETEPWLSTRHISNVRSTFLHFLAGFLTTALAFAFGAEADFALGFAFAFALPLGWALALPFGAAFAFALLFAAAGAAFAAAGFLATALGNAAGGSSLDTMKPTKSLRTICSRSPSSYWTLYSSSFVSAPCSISTTTPRSSLPSTFLTISAFRYGSFALISSATSSMPSSWSSFTSSSGSIILAECPCL
mmetsp:Transcript_57566/g.136913  ORF Transcript_57566/g.136913 Transcript_57566/m.136913 type:complete len:203 (+) Transcript_57566:86-694(+)